MPIDSQDQALLALLREDARTSTTELARRLKLSRTTVQSRIERLKTRGVITGFTVKSGETYERGQVQAHVMINALPKLSQRVEVALRHLPEVRKLYTISGVYDLIAIVSTDSVQAMDRLLDRIGALEGVDRTQSAIVLSTRIDR
ncbi:MAG TPA: Lrp/AsnC family transcriptional regulator [Dyella sp.]|uniref:Lrp/AsnC family transcriptional regulator n=1 Tax=Dyella sp. TaxID=1869338 RepID=UPI002D788729|nr:Lrp/AsnC family transcriptional regulator [Dyella sp.]HET6553629.1 Lrp/AsnC family transcriptional regulator [Dyella sp.]